MATIEQKENIFIYEEKYSHPYEIALNLTNDCNLACRYCFVEQKPDYMTLDIAIQSVKYVLENLRLHKEVYKDTTLDHTCGIWFFGGEPLLCFESIIKPLIEYCEKEDLLKDIHFTITTNATLLTKDKVDFFNKYKIQPMLSIDGAPTTQDFQRPCKNQNLKSSQLIEQNIPYILETWPLILFRSTIYKPTIHNMFENYLYAESMGFQNINFTPDTRQTNWTQQEYEDIKQELYKIFAYRLHQYRNGYFPIGCTNMTEAYQKILEHDINTINNIDVKSNYQYIYNCGLGTGSVAIDFKGNIYACQERPSRKKGNQEFLLGNIIDGINYEYHKKFLTQYMTEVQQYQFICHKSEICDTCISKPWCIKDCVSASRDLYDNFHTLNENHCIYNNMIIELCLNTMDILVKENNETFYKDLLRQISQYRIFDNQKLFQE